MVADQTRLSICKRCGEPFGDLPHWNGVHVTACTPMVVPEVVAQAPQQHYKIMTVHFTPQWVRDWWPDRNPLIVKLTSGDMAIIDAEKTRNWIARVVVLATLWPEDVSAIDIDLNCYDCDELLLLQVDQQHHHLWKEVTRFQREHEGHDYGDNRIHHSVLPV